MDKNERFLIKLSHFRFFIENDQPERVSIPVIFAKLFARYMRIIWNTNIRNR